jgi:hypothetical protein
MPDNKKLKGPPDNRRVDIHDPNELRNWSNALGCTQAELKRAVSAVGTSAEAVRKHLRK